MLDFRLLIAGQPLIPSFVIHHEDLTNKTPDFATANVIKSVVVYSSERKESNFHCVCGHMQCICYHRCKYPSTAMLLICNHTANKMLCLINLSHTVVT